jgi:hypothetical protein
MTLHRFSPMYQLMKRSKFACRQKAFEKEWFNWKYNLKLEKFELVELLKLAVKHQLFQIDGKLYEQVDGVAMGFPTWSTHGERVHVFN